MSVDMLKPEGGGADFFRWLLPICNGETHRGLLIQVISGSIYESMHICHNMQDCVGPYRIVLVPISGEKCQVLRPIINWRKIEKKIGRKKEIMKIKQQ